MVLATMPQMVQQTGYEIPDSVIEHGKQFWLENNTAHSFLSEFVELASDNRQEKAELYQSYSVCLARVFPLRPPCAT